MAALEELVSFLDEELRLDDIPDYPGALNGLQLGAGGEVTRVAAAVDASLPVVEEAVAAGAQLLVVHHGMFWNGAKPVTGALYRKFQAAIESGLAIYSAHIPLDVHPRFGNNARLVEELGLVGCEPFFDWKGIALGIRGRFGGTREGLVARAAEVLGASPHVCPAGPAEAGVVGVISGGCGSEVEAIAKAGIDTFLTGEGPHWSYTAAEELGLNVLYGGHYATETFGVRAICAHLAERFDLADVFLDHPTGM